MHCDKRSPKSVYIRGKNISTRYELYVGVIGYQGPAESLISKRIYHASSLRRLLQAKPGTERTSAMDCFIQSTSPNNKYLFTIQN
ncbi:21064_t:CDS:2 [Rhizophagus irregularis]|nr:21064_t:CDS:2 [Rhizophagus irregularis]